MGYPKFKHEVLLFSYAQRRESTMHFFWQYLMASSHHTPINFLMKNHLASWTNIQSCDVNIMWISDLLQICLHYQSVCDYEQKLKGLRCISIIVCFNQVRGNGTANLAKSWCSWIKKLAYVRLESKQ